MAYKKGSEQIREKLAQLDGEQVANAAYISKGHSFSTHRNGWHIRPFGKNEYFIGYTIADALDFLEYEIAERAELQAKTDAQNARIEY
jgi:hypothetical protein